MIARLVSAITGTLPAEDAARFLMILDNRLYAIQGRAAIRYGNGIHTKHRHLHYHDFFVRRIAREDTVLDVGCGIGVVAYEVAQKTGAAVTGIDCDADSIRKARAKFSHTNIRYVLGDATSGIPGGKFDVVILSNVLEHLGDRAGFLAQVVSRASPRVLLVRVPLFERDWRVPLKKELGVDYRLDPTHRTEYTLESFTEEMKNAGLEIRHLESRWGEIWAEVAPRGS